MSSWKDHQPYDLNESKDGQGCSCTFYRPPGSVEGSTNPDEFGVKIWRYSGDQRYADVTHAMQKQLHKHKLAPPVGEVIRVRCTNGEDSQSFSGLTTAIATVVPWRIMQVFANKCEETAKQMIEESDHTEAFKEILRECNTNEHRSRMDVWSYVWWKWKLGEHYETIQENLRESLIKAGFRSMCWDCHCYNMGIWKGKVVLIDCQPSSYDDCCTEFDTQGRESREID